MKNFKSLREFENYFKKIIRDEKNHHLAILNTEAQLIEDETKRKFGIYQPQAGPFKAWEPLAESTKIDRVRKGYSADSPLLRNGELMHSIYHVVPNQNEAYVGSDDPVMAYQELGTHGLHPIPARSVLGSATFENKKKLLSIVKEGVANWLNGRSPVRKKP